MNYDMPNNGELKLDSILMYGGLLFNWFFVPIATYFYTIDFVYHYLVIVLFLVVAMMSIISEIVFNDGMHNNYNPGKGYSVSKGPKTQLCLWIWLVWLVMGAVYHDVDPESLGEFVGLIQSVILLGLVLVTYWSSGNLFALIVLFCTYFMFSMVPHRDSMSVGMDSFLIVIKIGLFLIIYTQIAFTQFLSKFIIRNTRVVNEEEATRPIVDLESNAVNKEFPVIIIIEDGLTIAIQSSWILFTSRFLLPLVLLQFVIETRSLYQWIYSYKRNELPSSKKKKVKPVQQKTVYEPKRDMETMREEVVNLKNLKSNTFSNQQRNTVQQISPPAIPQYNTNKGNYNFSTNQISAKEQSMVTYNRSNESFNSNSLHGNALSALGNTKVEDVKLSDLRANSQSKSKSMNKGSTPFKSNR